MIDTLQLISIVISIGGSVFGAVVYINKYQNERLEKAIKQATSPLTWEIKSLNTFLADNKEDHKVIHDQLDALDKCVDDHELRITIIEKTKGRNFDGEYSS